MSSRELADLVEQRRRSRNDRLVRQIATHVVGECSRRCVAAILFLLQRLRDDRLDIAAQFAHDAAHRSRVALRDGLQSIQDRALRQGVGQLPGESLCRMTPNE